jgi:peptidoglycan/xylan/chitin deacetylase (PgdA/CDA1 family)
MDVIIVVHTEFGHVRNHEVVYDKSATGGVSTGVPNLIKVADHYDAKITFAVMPEVVKYFPREIGHEIGLHVHPGWEEFRIGGFTFQVGDRYLHEHCEQSRSSTALTGYPYKEQLDMIKTGADYLETELGERPSTFVSGRWSVDNNTVKALVNTGMKRDCSATPHVKPCHFDWSKLPRICMPYHPSEQDYQQKGTVPLLIIPVSQMFPSGSVSPEAVPGKGFSWLKACFNEYYQQGMPLFHICLHSPCMTDDYFLSVMDEFLSFMIGHKNVHFRFASEVRESSHRNPSTRLGPYLLGINGNIIRCGLRAVESRFF